MAVFRFLFIVLAAVAAAVFDLSAPSIAVVDTESNGGDQFRWEILTAKNFSSQIRLHPHVLLLVTVPWCGESRSLMRSISHNLVKEKHKYSSLKLMVVHRNLDKGLAKSLDVVEGITVLCYHRAVSYRYQGSLRAQDVLSSIHYLLSAASEELPFKRLNNFEDLDMFLASTDMSILLLESCGWTSKLLMQHYGNETLQGGVLTEHLIKETSNISGIGRQKNLKDAGIEMISSEIEDGYGFSPWVGEFSAQNETASSIDEDIHPTFEMSCSFEEYKKYESFFLHFVAMARDFYLPPQRQKYGLVSERLLLTPLGVEVSDQWSLVISYAGCPHCLRVLKDETHFRDVLERRDLPIMELGEKGGDLGPSLPIDKPSVLLFIDRTSDLAETRRKSQEALHALKEVALQYRSPDAEDGKNVKWPKRSSLQIRQTSPNVFGNQRLLLSTSTEKIKLNDKMSIMIINEGKPVALDSGGLNLQSSSLEEILKYVVGQKKQVKLSSLAKEAGFQLLSDDLDIKLAADVSSYKSESHTQDSTQNSIQDSDTVLLDTKDETEKTSPVVQQGQSTTVEAPHAHTEEEATGDDVTKESSLLDPHQSLSTNDIISAIDIDPKMLNYVLSEKSESLKHQFTGFTGIFLFSDCNHQFLKSLTNNSKIPRVVIIDPISQQHYVLSEGSLSSKSISTFIDGFLNGTLNPHRRSGPLRSSIEIVHPPFVNLNFHERDSIPSVTTDTFSELVFGVDQHDDQNMTNPQHKDVMVLFSNSWCGFCQRMELVVREVYRALKGYIDVLNSDPKMKEKFSTEELMEYAAKLPAIYSIDCTLNDCGWILKSMSQREVYPTLLLFPAEKNNPIPYDGNMMVTDVIKFIANYGNNSHHLAKHNGTLWIDEEERENPDDQFIGAFVSESGLEPLPRQDEYLEALKKNVESGNEGTVNPSEEANSHHIHIGSFLIATDQLHGLNLFSEARILIVAADHDIGFQGVIVSKPISWDSIKFEDAKLAEVLKVAPLSFGGPVVQEGLPFVSLTRNPSNDKYPEVLPGVYYLDPLATVKEIEKIKAGDQSAADYWFFWGYSGWGWNQLYSEIEGGSWGVRDGKSEDLLLP